MEETTDFRLEMLNALNDFYKHYIVDTSSGAFQVFQSFTYGEMTISLLLALILMVMLLKWVYEVLQ